MLKRGLVGWYLEAAKASHIYYSPERLVATRSYDSKPRSVQHCPAVQTLESRIFVIRCPFDIGLKLIPTSSSENAKQFEVFTLEEKTTISPRQLRGLFTLMPQNQWRQAKVPVFQISTPYIFVTDHPLRLRQTGPYLHGTDASRAGVTIAGEFPLEAWPRQLSFAFEWHRTCEPFVMKRGEPWFYVEFLDKREQVGSAPDLKHIIPSKKLIAYQAGTHGVVDHIGNTFGLIKKLQSQKRKKLLKYCTFDER